MKGSLITFGPALTVLKYAEDYETTKPPDYKKCCHAIMNIELGAESSKVFMKRE